ncbi:MAG: nuclear transport factor 2 family protein [Halieaceae bacterium]
MRQIVDQFYDAVRTGNVPALEALIAADFSLICPTQNNVLSGVYRGKNRFFEDVLPHVFGCVNPEEISFCAQHQIVAEAGEVVLAVAQNDGVALTGNRYDQIYLHIFKIRAGQIVALIEGFDTALANHALWGASDPLIPDEAATLSNLSRFMGA